MSTRSTSSMSGDGADQPPLALIAGPTASGKSDLALRLALDWRRRGRKAVIVNADSAQVYADLQVLSARPTTADMSDVPHRLYGTWDGSDGCSAADWARAARGEIALAHADGAVPIVVGGTGLYIRTLLDGIAPVPPIDPDVRFAVRALPVAEVYSALTREDPPRAALLSPRDTTRLCRALEVVRSTGRPLSAWQSGRSGGIADKVALRPLVLQPDRDTLYRRCGERFAAMLASGAIEEVEALLTRGLDQSLPVMRAIGVADIARYLRGACSRDEACAAGQRATRQYAKRQMTWLRHQLPAEWPRTELSQNVAKSEILLRHMALTYNYDNI